MCISDWTRRKIFNNISKTRRFIHIFELISTLSTWNINLKILWILWLFSSVFWFSHWKASVFCVIKCHLIGSFDFFTKTNVPTILLCVESPPLTPQESSMCTLKGSASWAEGRQLRGGSQGEAAQERLLSHRVCEVYSGDSSGIWFGNPSLLLWTAFPPSPSPSPFFC